jgi:hypothetical protein
LGAEVVEFAAAFNGFSPTAAAEVESGRRDPVAKGGKLEKSVVNFLNAHHRVWIHGLGADEKDDHSITVERADLHTEQHFTRMATSQEANPRPGPVIERWAEVAIPLQDLSSSRHARSSASASGPFGEESELVEWHAEGPPEGYDDLDVTPELQQQDMATFSSTELNNGISANVLYASSSTLRYPTSALRLVMELEAFKRQELERDPALARLYTQLLAANPSAIACNESVDDEEEAAEVGCGDHFFWLEVLSERRDGSSDRYGSSTLFGDY